MAKCKVCKEKYTPVFNSLTQKTCLKPECLAIWGKKLVEEKSKTESLNWIKNTKQKHVDNSHPYHQKLLQNDINEIVRLIDKDQLCISHMKMPLKRNAGHYHSVNANDPLRFHLENIWLQCEFCNSYRSSNRTGYDKGLRKVFGREYWLYINEELPLLYPTNKMSIPELKLAITNARSIISELKKVDMVYNQEERISLRKTYNLRIGIYTL